MTDDQRNLFNKNQIVEFLNSIEGFLLKYITRYGDERYTWNYRFRANAEALKKICKIALTLNIPNISVYLDGDNEVTYCLSVGHLKAQEFVKFINNND